MRNVLEKTRYLADVEAEEGAGGGVRGRGQKRGLKKETALTDEDIERSLAAIKSGLATVSDGQDTVVERFNEIGEELKQLDTGGELEFKEFKEEFKDIFETEDGAKLLDKDEELEDKIQEVNARLAEAAEPDEREQAPAAVKRQAKQREEGQADKRETDPEYLAKLEDFKRAQEALRLKQENFQRRQREYEEKKAAKLAEKEARTRALDQQQADFLKKRAGRGKVDHLAAAQGVQAEASRRTSSTTRPAPNKLQRYQSE